MKKSGNFKWIRSMMLLSQLLLILFVGQWLFTQFNSEREALKKEISLQFTSSRQEVMDSMIVSTFINPLKNGKKGMNVQIKIRNDSSSDRHTHIIQDSEKFILPGGKMDSIVMCDTIMPGQKKMTFMRTRMPSKQDLLLNGVKLIYKEVSSFSDDSTGSSRENFYYKTDTTLFKDLLAKKLLKNGLHFKTTWKNGDPKTKSKQQEIYLESNFFETPYGVEVSDYNFYLFRKIIPQLAFALVLLLLTGAAFLFAYRNLKEQIRLNTIRNDFISNISHELKTPVSTVKVAIEALQNFDMKNDPKVTSEYLEMAAQEMNRLDLLIDKVLNTSLLENNKQLVRTEKADLKTIVQDLLKSLQPGFDQRNALVNFTAKNETYAIMADKLHLQGVIINLIDNSLKYGPGKPVISINLEQTGQQVLLSVSDNGSGIPEEYIDRIFEKFFRVPGGNLHNVKGYGLGLNYSFLVMQQHEGTINVKNNSGGGCTFTLRFPKARS